MRIVIVNSLVLVLLCSVAHAGALATDPNALVYDGTMWCGSVTMKSSVPNGEGDYLQATIDYCVYAPGQFSYPGQGYTPTAGEFVYAYQVFVEPDVELFKFSVGMLESNEANNIGSFQMTGGIDPNTIYFSGSPVDSATWDWTVTPMQPGDKSIGLAYSSINAPLTWIGSIQDSGLSASGFLPSPSDEIPEPATLGLLLAGAVAAGLRRKRR